MNVVNRILVVVLILLLIPACIALFVAPVPVLRGLGQQMQTWARVLDAQSEVLRIAVGALFSLAWLVICVLVLVLELRPASRKTARVEKVGGGVVEISLRSIAERIAYDIDQLPGVLKVRPKVSARRGGVIAEVGPHTAKVQLLADPSSAVAAMLQQTRATGVVAGQPDGSLRMIYIPHEDEVQVGDIVLTSGLAGTVPRGLIIGQVASVEQKDFALFQEAVVRPALDYRQVEMVVVITSFQPLVLEEGTPAESP